MITVRNNLDGLMHQSGMKAHLFFSATHRVSRRWKPSCQFYTTADTLVSSLLLPPRLLDTVCFALLYLCTWPIHSISSTTLNSPQICTVQPIPFLWYSDSLAFSPPLLPNQSPVGLEVLKTISQSPALLAACLSCLSLLSPSLSPLTPTQFSLLPTFSPFTSSNKSSAST